MDLARGLKKIVRMYGERILAATGGWVDWKEPLGCAHYGCVWELANMDPQENDPEGGKAFQFTRRVLKISVDPTEGPVIAAIMNTGLDKTLHGLVRWEGVWRIPSYIGSAAGRSTAWVIIREEIEPLSISEPYAMWDRGEKFPWIRHLQSYNEKIRRYIDLKTPNRKEEAYDEASKEIAALYSFSETYYVAEAIEALFREGITLADIHQGNLGFRKHPTEEQPIIEVYGADNKKRPPLLIFDPGHSTAPPTEIPDLW